jgi:uncharacterized RDD family membrane protein YckC
LHDKLTIETPEQIPLEFPLAGIGSRFLAAALDSLIQLIVTLFMVIVGMVVMAGLFAVSSDVGLWGMGLFLIAIFVLQFGYFAVFEAVWNGQTPGKRFVHLRVIKDSGRPITTYEAVTRNLLRVVDSVPAYGVGIISMLVSAKNKRLGDYVAGTVVVHEKPLADQAKVSWNPAETSTPTGYDVGQLTQEEFQLIETFLLRREQLALEVRYKMARQITDRLAEKLQIAEEDRRRSELLLECLAHEYRSRAQYE